MQLDLFDDTILESVELIADSPKRAFWRLRLIVCQGEYRLEKESGAAGKILDRRVWHQNDRATAEKTYRRKIKAKMNPARGSPRKYRPATKKAPM